MRVTLILPALTEATSPLFRPIKYSLFPPLGLATLAAYLPPDAEVTIHDEHVQRLDLDDGPPPDPASAGGERRPPGAAPPARGGRPPPPPGGWGPPGPPLTGLPPIRR